MATWESRIVCNETYVSGGAENYSNVTLTFQIRCLDYRMNGYNSYGNAYWSISCDGQSSGNKDFSFNWGGTSAGSWWTVGSYNFKIPHNSDGSKTISYSAYYSTGISPSSFSASGSSVLTKIGRYVTITSFNVSNQTQTSAVINWNTDAVCDWLTYSLNGSDWIGAAGNSFEINGLKPGTQYSIKISVRRKDSQLKTESNTINFSTLPIATISSPVNFDIGKNINLSFLNYTYNKSFLRLYQKNADDEWILLDEKEDIQSSEYAWDTSGLSSTMYANTPDSNNSEIKIVCGTMIDETEYSNEYLGIAHVTNSNPIMPTFQFANTDSKSSEMLGNSTSMITYYGNLRITISQKATPKNYATILYYNISVGNGSTTSVKRVEETSSDIFVDFGNYQSPGTYTIRVEAVDSRGNISNLVSQNLVVYTYHDPSITATLMRVNNFEQETGLTLVGYISRVYTTSNKNSLVSLRYRYRETNGTWSDYNSLSPSTISSGSDFKINYTNDLFINLDVSKTYEFQFEITDKIKPTTINLSVGQGIPILCVADSSTVLIGEAPTQENLHNPCNLIVGTDIVAKMNGRQYRVLESIDKKIVFSEDEPEGMMDGSIWAEIRATIPLS